MRLTAACKSARFGPSLRQNASGCMARWDGMAGSKVACSSGVYRAGCSFPSPAPLADSDAAARIGLGCNIDGKGSEDLARTNQSSVTYGS